MAKYDQSYIGYDHVKEVFPDAISVGNCINIYNCESTNVDLADGWCVDCWDKGKDAKRSIKIVADRRKEEKQTKLLLKEVRLRKAKYSNTIPRRRGRHKKDCQCDLHIKKGVT